MMQSYPCTADKEEKRLFHQTFWDKILKNQAIKPVKDNRHSFIYFFDLTLFSDINCLYLARDSWQGDKGGVPFSLRAQVAAEPTRIFSFSTPLPPKQDNI